jgi:hypothetical protein
MGHASRIRYRRTGSRLNRRLTAVAVLGVAGCALFLALSVPRWAPEPVRAAPVVAATAPAVLAPASLSVPVAAPRQARRVYPYSIIPGGVSDRNDVARMVATDKVVAAHYASLDVSKVRELTVTRPHAVYVSYRKGDKVYWTAKKLMLAEGETLLSDGSSEIRTRCGNRISDVPQLPVEVKGPTPEELDSPVDEAQQVQQAPEQPGLSFASFAMDEIGDMPSFAGQAYQLPTSVNAAVVAQGGSESPFRGKPGHLPLADGLDAVPVSVVDWAPHSTGRPPAAGNSGSGGTPDTPAAPATSPIQVGGGTGNTSETQAPVNPTLPTVPADPVPGKPAPADPVPATPDGGPKVPPTIPDELLSPSPFPPVQPGKTPPKPGEVPEPPTLWLSGVALAALLLLRRKGARRATTAD